MNEKNCEVNENNESSGICLNEDGLKYFNEVQEKIKEIDPKGDIPFSLLSLIAMGELAKKLCKEDKNNE